MEIYSYKRWTDEELSTLKEMYTEGRDLNIPHKELWKNIARKLKRKPSEVQRRLIRLYSEDEDLKGYKFNNWNKESILENIKDLYLSGHQINKNSLPQKLAFILLKVTSENSERRLFESFDHALAEAILRVGFKRKEDGLVDFENKINDISEALEYIRLGHKKRHIWDLGEIKKILKTLHTNNYPLTMAFLAHHQNIYGNVIGINRKLESWKDVIKKFIEDQSITSFAELVCEIAPEYLDYYNEDKTRLKFSTEELRVKKFLDKLNIKYAIPRLNHKIRTNFKDHPNFVPDFMIFDKENNLLAIVEVFGSIGDRENNGVNNTYRDKTEVKRNFYNQFKNIDFIEVFNNKDKCDLDDKSLSNLFEKFSTTSKG